MIEVEVSRLVPAPRRVVWDRYTDHAGWTGWAGLGRVSIERPGDPPPNGVGCVRLIRAAGLLAIREEVLEMEPPSRMVYTVLGGMPLRDHRGEVRFSDEGGGTRVTWGCRFRPAIPGTGGLSRAVVTRTFRQVLRRLADELAAAG